MKWWRWTWVVWGGPLLVACGPRSTSGADTESGGAEATSAPAVFDLGADSSTSAACDEPAPPAPMLETCEVTPLAPARVEVEGISDTWSEAMMPCTVGAITALPLPERGVELELRCTSPERGPVWPTIRVTSDEVPPLPLSSGDEVLFGFAGGGLFDEMLLTLRRPDTTLLLAWISAMWVPTAAEPSIPSAAFFEPLVFAYDWEGCGYVCDTPDSGCFIVDSCPCTHRLALDVSVGDERRCIVDGDRATLGDGFIVHVVRAISGPAAPDGGPCIGLADGGPWFQVLASERDGG